MSIDAIQQAGASLPTEPKGEVGISTSAKAFDAMLTTGLDKVNDALKTSDASLQAYAAGADVPVHQVMIDMEKARIALQTAVEVRNHLVDAYQEFMRMQL